MWHIPPDKKAFDRSRMWKAARRVVKLDKPGSVRIACILRFAKMETDISPSKKSREEDMINCVYAVMAIVSSRFALSVLNDTYLKKYTKSLDPNHKVPHHLKTNRIIEVMIDVGMREFTYILADCRDHCRSLGIK